MIIIWRSWGWLTLPILLAVWGLADGPIATIYRNASGYANLYNPDKGVCWGISFLVISIPFAALAFWRRHAERTRTPAETAIEDDKRRQDLKKFEASRIASGLQPDPKLQAIIAGTAPLPPFTPAKSSFFFIPFWIMPIVFAALGILVLVLNVPAALEGH
jgi:hypothetical protein